MVKRSIQMWKFNEPKLPVMVVNETGILELSLRVLMNFLQRSQRHDGVHEI